MKNTLKVIYNFQTKDKYYKNLTLWNRMKWFMARTTRNISIVALFVLTGFTSAKVYNSMHPYTVFADKEVIKEVPMESPVLDRIAKCESNNSHLDKSGQVLMKTNDNKSVDVGVMQINSLWFKKASELGYNLTIEKDNRAFAQYLYANYGTEPWVWSKACWK